MRLRLVVVTVLLLAALPALADPVTLRIAWLEDSRQSRPLIAYLRDGNAAQRARAARALGRIQDPATVLDLARAANDANATVATEAVFALGQMWDGVAEASLLHIVAVHPSRVAVEALGKCAGPRGLAVLDGLLRSPLRGAAAEAIAIVGYRIRKGTTPPVAPEIRIRRLAGLLKDADPEVREAAAYALFRWQGACSAELLQALQDKDAQVRIHAARALAVHHVKAPELIQALQDADWRVRVAALEAIQDPSASTAVSALFSSEQPNVAIAALRCAASLKPDDAALKAALAVHRSVVKAEALLTWTRVHHSPDQALALYRSDDWRVRAAAARGLGWLRADLSLFLTDPDARVRAAAVEAGVSDEALLKAVADPDESVAEVAGEALAAHPVAGSDGALLARLGALRSADSGELMATLIAALHGNNAYDWLKAHLGDPDVEVRQASAAALTRITGRKIAALPPPLPPTPAWVTATLPTRATVLTNRGRFLITLRPDEAPGTVWNFARLARRHYFSGILFHRVVPNFVVQGGDPRGNGTGGPGYTIRCEINPLRYERGAVGMALAGKDTGGSQWFVTHSAQPHLNGRYTIFGQVTSGMDVVDSLMEGDRILDVLVEPGN